MVFPLKCFMRPKLSINCYALATNEIKPEDLFKRSRVFAMRIPFLLIGTFLLAAALSPALAQTAPNAKTSLIPTRFIYGGVGGAFMGTQFSTQDVYAKGTSDVYRNGTLIQTGEADADPYPLAMGDDLNVAPIAQLGYMQKIGASAWMGGVKLNYFWLNQSSTKSNVLLPQFGGFTTLATGAYTPFTGNAYVRHYDYNVQQSIALMPIVGYALDRTYLYFGAGPTLTQTQTNIKQLIGFARINGEPTDVSGLPVDFTASSWVWGGAVTVGATFFITDTWFLDFNYQAGWTGTKRVNYFAPFTNPNGANGTNIVGNLIGWSKGSSVTQGVTVTINRAFAL